MAGAGRGISASLDLTALWPLWFPRLERACRRVLKPAHRADMKSAAKRERIQRAGRWTCRSEIREIEK
jgi:hypothetical protein